MQRLTAKSHWAGVHAAKSNQPGGSGGFSWIGRLKNALKARLGEAIFSYNDYLLWSVLYNRFFSQSRGQTVIEVGSAPGSILLRLHQMFGLVPFGVEYEEEGAEVNRQLFRDHGIDPDHVIQDDFFSSGFQARHAERFDVVMSRGFIEHFTDVPAVVALHVALLKPGGLLIIEIPRLTGIYNALCRVFHNELLSKHNLHIMERSAFAELFDNMSLTPLHCDYFGAFSFAVLNTKVESGPRYVLLRLCMVLQIALNAGFRLTLGDKGMASRRFSPSLLFIGRKARIA